MILLRVSRRFRTRNARLTERSRDHPERREEGILDDRHVRVCQNIDPASPYALQGRPRRGCIAGADLCQPDARPAEASSSGRPLPTLAAYTKRHVFVGAVAAPAVRKRVEQVGFRGGSYEWWPIRSGDEDKQ